MLAKQKGWSLQAKKRNLFPTQDNSYNVALTAYWEPDKWTNISPSTSSNVEGSFENNSLFHNNLLIPVSLIVLFREGQAVSFLGVDCGVF